MTSKLAFTLATILALGAVPRMAHASCSGSACNSFSVESRNFSSSDKRAKAVLSNKDQNKKIHLKGCITSDGKCGGGDNFDVTIDPTKSTPNSGPATEKFVIDVTTAEFVPQQPPPIPSLTKTDSGCTLKNIGPNGCPPKLVTDWEDIKKKGDEADAALDKAEADLKGLDPKGKAKFDDIMQRYAKAKITVDFVRAALGKEPGQPAENINYVTKLAKKEDDLGKELKAKAIALFGCMPKIDKTSVSCERDTNVGGGKK